MANHETNPGQIELRQSMEILDNSDLPLTPFAKDAIRKAVESVDPDAAYALWLTHGIRKNVDNPTVKMTPEMLFLYEEVFTDPKEHQFNELPEHKIQWYMQSTDIIWQATGLIKGQPVSKDILHEVARNFGLFSAEYVDPKIEAEYRATSNWKFEKGYGGSMNSRFVGDRRIQDLATKHNHFEEKDFEMVLSLMVNMGHIQTVFVGGLWPDYTRPNDRISK